MIEPDLTYLLSRYPESDFPALRRQMDDWRSTRPLAGVRVLDATPVFFNTGLKYMALLSAGAKLSIACHPDLPFDPEALEFYRSSGMDIADNPQSGDWQVVCDCAGKFKHLNPEYGVVELTGSGAAVYQNHQLPVFLADGGKIKVIETGLGTGDGVFRALELLGYTVFSGKRVVIFGGGKVGSGVAMAFASAGADVVVVDLAVIGCCRLPVVRFDDRSAVEALIKSADYICTATGKKDALAGYADILYNSRAVLFNAGVEDEYGDFIPETRVLNRKKPVNFILDEPTGLKFIDPTLALSNLGILELLNHRCHCGINLPPEQLEDGLMQILQSGSIAGYLPQMKEFYL